MKTETKEKLLHGLTVVAMVTPPWNIFWWAVGVVLYEVHGGRDADASGDGALGMVIFAPVTLPLAPFFWWKERKEWRGYRQTRERKKSANAWVAEKLQSCGIKVVESDADKTIAEPTERQLNAYRSIYADALRLFRGLPAADICLWSKPLAPLNRTWAETYGLDDWAVECFSPPCADCGTRENFGFRFGKNQAEETVAEEETKVVKIIGKDGLEREVAGFICRQCIEKTEPRLVITTG